MKITWLGQAGLLLEAPDITIMIDPYLSDSVGEKDARKHRRVPVKDTLFSVCPDVMIFTHNHLDHYDPETVKHFVTERSCVTVLAPSSVYYDVRRIGGENNYVKFDRHTEWTEKGIRFTAVKAEHSDPSPIGVLIDDGEHVFYVTGDTLYSTEIFDDLPENIYAVFLPINGVGNNMNMTDAQRFCERIRPRFAVPLHCGMLDAIDPHDFAYKNTVVPTVYEEVKFS